MKLPDSWIEEIGAPIDGHVVQSLARIISPDRIHVRRRFFSDTLQAPLRTKAAIVHLDCDLYQSAIGVLAALERDSVLQDGTVLMFDDWNCNRANPAYGQRRAFRGFLETHSTNCTASHYMNYGFTCSAFILHVNA